MSRIRITGWALALVCAGGIALPATAASEADADAGKPRQDGEVTVVVTAQQEVLDTASTKVDAARIETFNQETVGNAVKALPGVSFSVNSRNEQMIYVRGNDSRQVPIFIDGIPAYVPYDGEMDYGRFTTYDLAEIQVAKGFSSVLYGPDTLGGAINLVTKRPTETFQGDGLAGLSEGNGKRVALNVGGAQRLFYYQVSGSYLSSDRWRMSGDFKPTSTEDGTWRNNSYTMDKKLSLKFGLTPNDTDEYAVGYLNQKGDKGNPVSTDPALKLQYWQWPTWDKEDVYLSTRTALGAKSNVQFKLFHDTYVNTLNAFTNGTYTTLATSGSFAPTGISKYDDYTDGAIGTFETTLIPANSVRAVVMAKSDVHRESSGNVPSTEGWTHYQDDYLSLGLEDSITLAPAWSLALGGGWDQQRPRNSGAWGKPAPKGHYHGQVGLFWNQTKDVQYYLTFAQKDHFATLKDRYSGRQGTFVPNPGLVPETSANYEAGVKATLAGWVHVEGALFRSDIHNLIQSQALPGGMKENINLGKVRHQGIELSVDLKPADAFEAGVNYTYLDRNDISSPSTVLTSTPRNRVTVFTIVKPVPTVHVAASLQAQDAMWDTYTNAIPYHRLGGFATTDLSAGWNPWRTLEVDGGFTNLFDRNYQLTSGYPLPGRSWFANARYRF